MTQIIDNFAQISDQYEAALVDLWGCLHNGVKPFAAAVAALEAFRDNGGTVLLLTNSPRPSSSVYLQLDEIGVARDLYQACASSGDAARAALASGAYGKKVYALGPDRDAVFYEGFDHEDFYQGIDIERVPLDQAEGVVCTGLFDDTVDTPEDYRALFLNAKNRGLKMLCANPDIMVDRGDKRIYCAGALAQAYSEMGGEAHYFGKPHPPIYDLAYRRLVQATGRESAPKKIIGIGDGINTDIRGAIGEDIDSLFVTGGLAASETATDGQPDPDKLTAFLEKAQLTPTYSIGHLR
jgi:HAD superfamily hydrolase (TIGR01459 family)